MTEQALVYTIVLILTIVAPYCSLFLFIVVSPWTAYASEILKWDPRLGWAVILAVRASLRRHDKTTQSLPGVAIGAVVSFALIAYVKLRSEGSEVPADGLRGAEITVLYFLVGMCAGYAIVTMTDTKTTVRWLVSSACWSLMLASGFGILQASSGALGERISGTTGNPNSSAAHLSLASTVMLLCWRLKLPGSNFCLVAVASGTLACILTFSRMGIIACFIGLVLTFLLTKTKASVNWKLIAVSIIALTAVVGLGRSYLASVRNTLPYAGDASHTELAVASQEMEDLTRLEAAHFSLQQFSEHPVFGVGLSTIADRNYEVNGLYVTSHNTYAQLLAGTGLVGGWLIVLVIISVFRGISPSMKRYLIPVGAEIAFCAFFADLLQQIEIIVIFALLIAILRCLAPSADYAATLRLPG